MRSFSIHHAGRSAQTRSRILGFSDCPISTRNAWVDTFPIGRGRPQAYPIAVRFVFLGSSKGSVWAVAVPATPAPRTSKGVP